MNNVELRIENKHQLIVVPVVRTITNNILRSLGTDKFERVIMDSEISGRKTDQSDDVKMKGDGYLVVSFEEKITQQAQAIGESSHIMTPPILIDENIGFSIHATHASSSIKIKLKGYSNSRNRVRSIFDEYFSRINQNYETIIHDVEYKYELPNPILVLSEHIHDLREARSGYGDTLKEYIEYNSSANIRFSSNAAGTVSGVTVVEKQTRIPSALRPVVHENKNFDKDEDTGMYVYEIECDVIINIPMSIRVSYPLMIHNGLLKKEFIPRCYTDNYNIKIPEVIFDCLVNFEQPVVLGIVANDICIKIPKEDNFIPGFQDQPSLRRMVMILTQVDPEERFVIADLNDLGDKLIEPTVLGFLKLYHKEICLYQHSIFKINVYSNNVRVHDDTFYCTPDLVVMSKEKLGDRTSYRVSISILGSFVLLFEKAWQDILSHPKALVEIIVHLNRNILGCPQLHEIYNSKSISSSNIRWLNNIRNKITGQTNGFK